MKSYVKLKIIQVLILIGFFGCSEKEKVVSANEDTGPISITTTNVNVADFYFDLNNNSEAGETESWHVAVKTEGDYNMPSIFFHEEMKIAVYEDLVFDELSTIPETFNSDIQMDHATFRYEGSNEILSYNIEVHKVGVTNPNCVYVMKDEQSDKSYKIQFIEYISGVTVFQYDEL